MKLFSLMMEAPIILRLFLMSLEKANSHFVRVVHLLRNYGQTAALCAGIDYSRFEIIVPMDADLQNDPMIFHY